MRPDQLSLAVRPRHPFEAADLGVRLLLANWRTVYRVWPAVFLPVLAVLMLLEHVLSLPLSMALLWWLKPFFDMCVLWVLSRAVFGETMTVTGTLRAVPAFFRSGLGGYLLWRRVSMSRGFVMPVRLLEELHGRALDDRISLMRHGYTGRARWVLQIFAASEMVLLASLVSLTVWLTPAFQDLDILDTFLQAETGDWRRDITVLFYALAMSLVEPFYVAAGFMLYLNRRTDLEAWDIEIAFRQLANRLDVSRGKA